MQRPSWVSSAAHAPALEHLDALVGARPSQTAGARSGARSRRRRRARSGAGCDHPRAERQTAVGVGVEHDAERVEVLDRGGRLLDQHPGCRRSHGTATGRKRVLEVQLGAVLRRRAPPRGRPAPSSSRSRASSVAETSVTSRALAGGAERGVEARGAGADDDQLPLGAAGHGRAWPGTVPAHGTGAGLPLAPVLAASTTPATIPSGSGGSRRSTRCSSARTGSATSASSSPAVERSVLERVHAAAHIDAIAAPGRAPAAASWTPTRSSAPAPITAALHAAGGAVELVRRLRRRAAPGQVGFSAHRPPGHHAADRPRDGLLPVQQRRRRGPPRARRARPASAS